MLGSSPEEDLQRSNPSTHTYTHTQTYKHTHIHTGILDMLGASSEEDLKRSTAVMYKRTQKVKRVRCDNGDRGMEDAPPAKRGRKS